MKSLIAALLLLLAVLASPAALADTTSIADVGDKNLGFSVGTTGGSASLGGYTTTTDGFGTLHGSTTLVGPGLNAGINQSYTDGFKSTTTLNNLTQTTELNYYGGYESEWNTPNGSFELYCAPTTGCTTETN